MIITLQTLIYFRESLLNALYRLLRPYYKKFSLTFGRNGEVSDDEESEEQVFAEYDEEKGVVFYPPVYVQRYAAVSDCLMDERWCGKLEKVVDIGYHDMSFIKYLKEVPGIKCILGVDIETIPLRCSSDLIGSSDYIPKREHPLQVTLFKGNAADPDYRLIGCDAVIAIEMIEHMLPHDLDRLIHTVFGFIKPMIAIFTTPNGDFNVLFKSLEKNGLRRLDHFFEWSREQFHDWCSNIIVRYPQYTVSCKGIGPGPPGTLHLGCCSQMALFIANEYTKQQDLNLNSLALVSDSPSPNSISNLISSWENSVIPDEINMIAPVNNIESFTELNSEKQSCITIVLTSPAFSLESLSYEDKTSQCDLDSEVERNYLMFDYEQMCFDLVVPRRKIDSRVYIIEDVNSRLNCTTLQVKKFSKTTRNLMAKNKVDSLIHTREVVDEIRQLTKMLNFNKECLNQLPNAGSDKIWYNINWGENAPYWNQYYKIVKEFNYPFETKSEECRVLELISDEINRLIDAQFDDDLSMDMNQLEIPIQHLMGVVDHITDDVDKVKELLEWNGYEVLGDRVIHSRLVVDNASVGTHDDDWQETDTYSDSDSSDMRSTSISDGNTNVLDYNATSLRRALDYKVRKLRTMLTADKDITTELDQVVCRLLKLALRTSKGRQNPLPTKWMQCKLLDLLTLTEKSIERRKIHFIESYALKAINYDEKSKRMMALEKIKKDDTALRIFDKYKYLVKQTDESRSKYKFIDLKLDDDLSVSSADFAKDYDLLERHPPSLNGPDATLTDTTIFDDIELAPKMESSLERTQAWVEDDVEIVPYPDHDANIDKSSGDTDQSIPNIPKYYKKYKEKESMELKCVICKKSHSNTLKNNRHEKNFKEKCSKTKLVKKVSRKKSSNHNLGKSTCNKCVSAYNKAYVLKPRRKQYKTLYPSAAKPIPSSLIELCHPEMMIENVMASYTDNYSHMVSDKVDQNIIFNQQKSEVAATKQSLVIGIITDVEEETLALRRTIGTDADVDPLIYEEETLIRSVSNTNTMNEDIFLDKHHVATENVHSQTIFLYDIDEPTTSKGIRHIGMDVQCGPDTSVPAYSVLSATTSLSRMPKLFTAGIKIGDSVTKYCTTVTKIKIVDCSTSTNGTQDINKTITARERSVGIIIKDSDSCISKKTDESHSTTDLKTNITDCSTSINDTYNKYNTLVANKGLVGTEIKDSDSNISKPDSSQFSTDIKTDITNCGISIDNNYKQFNTLLTIERLVGTNSKDFNSNKIEQTDIEIDTADCGTFTYSNQDIEKSPVVQQISVGIKGKDFDSHALDQMECSTNTSYNEPSISITPQIFLTETHSLKSIPSGLKLDDSLSEIYGSAGSFVKIPSNSLENNKLQKIISSATKDVNVSEKLSCKYVKPKLGPGGVQVHSFRDKQMSEDIMYQGEWQKNRPKVLTRRKNLNPVIPKKINEANLKKRPVPKEKITNRNAIKSDLKPARRCLMPCNTKLTNLKQESARNEIKRNQNVSFPAVVAKTNKPFGNIIKVPSKITMSSVSAKNPKSAGVVKNPSFISNLTVTKNVDPSSEILKKNYIPLYLRRRLLKSANDNNKNNLNLSLNSDKLSTGKEKATKKLVRSKTVEIKRDLLKFQTETAIPNFVVLRNEIEKKDSSNDKQQNKNNSDNAKIRDTGKQRQLSPKSENSSTCSSPNSVATVKTVSLRTKNVADPKHSLSSFKLSTANSDSENTTPDRNKKDKRRSKIIKTASVKAFENKENIPQTSKKKSSNKKGIDIFGKGSFMGQKKDVYIAHVKESPPLQSNAASRSKAQKSSVNIPKADTRSQSPSVSKKISINRSDVSSPIINKNEESKISQTSDMVLVIDPQVREFHDYTERKKLDSINVANNHLVTNWIDSYREGPESTRQVMRQLIDEAIDFIDDRFDDNSEIDSETVILSRENTNNSMEISASPASFKTVITNDGNYSDLLQCDIEHALNRSFDVTLGDESILSLTDTKLTVTDFDMLSFKSVTSTSRLSEYLSADNEFSSSHGKLITISPDTTTVHDIYERKDPPVCNQNPPGALAIQAFSGFSLNSEPVPGDQIDPINFIDSETGSLSVDRNRQATSEELFISGRSSDSFESCLLDEDAVVPNWLFQIISQQQSAMDELEPPAQLMVPLPLADPMYDANGNVMDGPGQGAGAGDGRGIHSDHSQDSSGRGTSVSSSETSSGAQSEGILIDPSGFVAQFELLRDAMDNSGVVIVSDPSESLENAMGSSRQGPIESDTHSFSRGESRRLRRPVAGGSDVDADVSSLDTDDVPDSSDN